MKIRNLAKAPRSSARPEQPLQQNPDIAPAFHFPVTITAQFHRVSGGVESLSTPAANLLLPTGEVDSSAWTHSSAKLSDLFPQHRQLQRRVDTDLTSG